MTGNKTVMSSNGMYNVRTVAWSPLPETSHVAQFNLWCETQHVVIAPESLP
jgi:hypothetical protein